MTDRFERTARLLSQEKFDKLTSSVVAVIGVGGVGGFVAEFLARAGVGNLILVDYDVIDITNINRQIIALSSNIGLYKVDEFKKRLSDINPNINIIIHKEKISPDNFDGIITKNIDYVADCIDDIPNKIELIDYCSRNCINIISSMGVGNRYKLCNYEITDIFKTEQDKLAKILRKKLRERGIVSLTAVCTKSPAENNNGAGVASISYLPPMAASMLAGYVVNRLIND